MKTGNINPEDLITREEAITICARAFIKNEELKISGYIDGDEVSSWAVNSMSTFIKYAYIKGYEDGSIRPKANITRAEVISILTRIFKEIIISGKYQYDVSGNVIINGSSVAVENALIKGNVLITEGTNGKAKFTNTTIDGNLILRTPLDMSGMSLDIKGSVIKLYESIERPEVNKYISEEYGINFSLPKNSKVIELTKEEQNINYKEHNLVLVKIESQEDLHFVSFDTAVSSEMSRYDNIYTKVIESEIDDNKFGVYYDNLNTYFMLIKRNDIIYTVYFYNVVDYNVVDNVINSVVLTSGEKVHNHEILVYRNSKLSLKFKYLDYIGVDDSYNTKNVFEGDTYFKLFIQVNKITDMGEYKLEYIQMMLNELASKEGETVSSKIVKKEKYDAIEIIVRDGEKLTRSFYIISNNMLYDFIFTGKESQVESIGNELFDEVIKSIEI